MPSESTFDPNSVVYFKDKANNILKPELLDDLARKQALSFPDGKLSKSQIRRFFGAIKNMHMQLETKGSWEQIYPLFKMFQSKVAYAERAGNKKIPHEFADFLKAHIKKVNDEKDFKAFVLFFEAVLGFAYGESKIGD